MKSDDQRVLFSVTNSVVNSSLDGSVHFNSLSHVWCTIPCPREVFVFEWSFTTNKILTERYGKSERYVKH